MTADPPTASCAVKLVHATQSLAGVSPPTRAVRNDDAIGVRFPHCLCPAIDQEAVPRLALDKALLSLPALRLGQMLACSFEQDNKNARDQALGVPQGV